jgi:hypothetical protein
MSVLAAVRKTILLAFASLPLLLISFVGFLAIGLGNMSLFLLFIGHAILVPAITLFIHSFITKSSGVLVTPNDAASLVPLMTSTGQQYKPMNTRPTYWMAHMAFFFGYLITNAILIISAPPPDVSKLGQESKDTISAKIQARVQKASMILTVLLILYAIICYLRAYTSGTENAVGIFLAQLFLVVGGLWYWVASVCGASNSDIYGIAMQMMSSSSAQDKPKMCVYTGIPS